MESKYEKPSHITFSEDFVSSKHHSNYSRVLLNTPPKPFEEEHQNNNKVKQFELYYFINTFMFSYINLSNTV